LLVCEPIDNPAAAENDGHLDETQFVMMIAASRPSGCLCMAKMRMQAQRLTGGSDLLTFWLPMPPGLRPAKRELLRTEPLDTGQ